MEKYNSGLNSKVFCIFVNFACLKEIDANFMQHSMCCLSKFTEERLEILILI